MAGEEWKQEAEKLGGQKLVEKLTQMADSLSVLASNADKSDDRIRDAEVAIQKLYSAFPANDVEGHRRYHELIIENTAEKRRLRVAIQEKTISGLVWAAIVGFAMMVWTGFLHFIGK